MKKYLVKRTAIRNGIKETTYIGKMDTCCDNINEFNYINLFNRKMTAQNCMYEHMYGNSNCKVLNIEVVEVK